MIAVLAVAASLSRPAWAQSEFLNNLHKAESRREPEERVEYLDRAIDAWAPDEGNALLANAYMRRGEARYQLDDFARAEPDLSKAIGLDPLGPDSYLLRGRLRFMQGKTADAERDFHEFVGLKSEDIEGWLALGGAQVRAGELKPALESYQRAEQIDAGDWRVAFGRSKEAMARKDWEGAIELLASAGVAAKGRGPEIFVERAICKVALGEAPEALADYDASIPLYDRLVASTGRTPGLALDAADAREKAARAYFGRGRVNEFLKHAEAAADDYVQACRLGYAHACAKARALGAANPESGKPAAKPKTRADSDAGDRVYGN